ncbi:MAG: GNAT family N-acetyltransferase [Deltaproteobacteria bacterium]|nr:GNAT family N-acetyltransferase [Deltaproteobacteria bacterium]
MPDRFHGGAQVERLVQITYLEMTSATEAASFDRQRKLDVRRAEVPCPELNRFLYTAVGSDWWWYDRLGWSRAKWLAYLDRPELETWVAYLSGSPAGYFELEAQGESEVELAYCGLLPMFIGRGLGSELLATAIERAWQREPQRVWLHTCSLDHPRALQSYQSHGFKPYRTEEEIKQLPDTPLEFWPGS